MAEEAVAKKDPKAALKESGFKPDLKKRGSLRTTFDGGTSTRVTFRRCSGTVRRRWISYRWNDPELFDLQSDPAR
jgi:arylsulfatase